MQDLLIFIQVYGIVFYILVAILLVIWDIHHEVKPLVFTRTRSLYVILCIVRKHHFTKNPIGCLYMCIANDTAYELGEISLSERNPLSSYINNKLLKRTLKVSVAGMLKCRPSDQRINFYWDGVEQALKLDDLYANGNLRK